MKNIGQLTVDDSGSLAIPHEVCERLGFSPGEKLAVERLPNGAATLKSVSHATNGCAAREDETGELKLIEKDGVLVFTLERDEPLPEVAAEWLLDPVKHDRELRMRELMKGCGVEGFD